MNLLVYGKAGRDTTKAPLLTIGEGLCLENQFFHDKAHTITVAVSVTLRTASAPLVKVESWVNIEFLLLGEKTMTLLILI